MEPRIVPAQLPLDSEGIATPTSYSATALRNTQAFVHPPTTTRQMRTESVHGRLIHEVSVDFDGAIG